MTFEAEQTAPFRPISDKLSAAAKVRAMADDAWWKDVHFGLGPVSENWRLSVQAMAGKEESQTVTGNVSITRLLPKHRESQRVLAGG